MAKNRKFSYLFFFFCFGVYVNYIATWFAGFNLIYTISIRHYSSLSFNTQLDSFPPLFCFLWNVAHCASLSFPKGGDRTTSFLGEVCDYQLPSSELLSSGARSFVKWRWHREALLIPLLVGSLGSLEGYRLTERVQFVKLSSCMLDLNRFSSKNRFNYVLSI